MNIIKKVPLLGKALSAFSRTKEQAAFATLEITTIFPCAISCKICPQDKWKHAYKGNHRLTYDEFCKVLEKIPKHVRLDFSGFSEPFLNRESSLMMRHAYQNGYQVALYTTLVGFTQNDSEIIKDIHFSACTLHIPDNTNFKVPDENKWLESYKMFAHTTPHDNAIYHMGKISARLKREIARICRPPVLTRSNNLNAGVVRPLSRHKGIIRCSISGNLFHQNVMMPNGDVYLCCMDWSLQHKLGNLFEQSYEDMHNNEEYHRICRSMNDASLETICRYCERSINCS